jgi:CheY-like chemotaxis protein
MARRLLSSCAQGISTWTDTRNAPGLAASCKNIPVIALPAYAMTGDREKFLVSGMDDYPVKPVSLENLQRMIEKHAPCRESKHACLTPRTA